MSSDTPQSPPPPQNERDPYPRMIIACMCVSAVLFVIIASVVLYDFIKRQMSTAAPTAPVVGLPPQPFRAAEDAALQQSAPPTVSAAPAAPASPQLPAPAQP